MDEGFLETVLTYIRRRGCASAGDVAAACGTSLIDACDALMILSCRDAIHPVAGSRFAIGPVRAMPGRSYITAIASPTVARLMAAR